jgi:hypothetical protein
MNLDDFNGVRSNIIDQGTPPPSVAVSRDRTFILGTARKGPRHTPVTATSETVQEIFGNIPLDGSFDTSLVRGYYEYANSSVGPPDVALIRIGEVQGARIDMYENTATLSGDLSYTLVNGHPAYSMWLEALEEGAEYNGAKVTVSEDEVTSYPSHIRIELPDGSTAGYNLSPLPGVAGVVNSVSELSRLINANENFSGKIRAGFDPLTKEVDVTVTTSGGVVNRTYDLNPPAPGTNESWGDKIVGLVNVYQMRDVESEADAGSTSADLSVTPEKSMNIGVQTIDDFIRVSGGEMLLTVGPLQSGQTNYEATLYCASVSSWDNSYDITGNIDHDWVFALHVKRNGTTSMVELDEGTKYTVNKTTGKVTIKETLTVGDVYYTTYRYKVTYAEAKYRSDLLDGADNSYFIYGGSIIFGADQPAALYMYYVTKVYFDSGDIEIDDFDNSVITFINASNLPVEGVGLKVEVAYEPELPAGTGKVLPGSIVQPGSLSGGSDGRIMTPSQHKVAVKEALEAVDLYPRRRMVVMGMFLDDVVDGYNEETGLPEEVPNNLHTTVLPYVDRTSNLANECETYIPPRPLTDLSQDSINAWIKTLTENSDTDLNRPANMIDAISNFRADAPLGVLIGAISEVNYGRRYFMNPACVYAAYKQNMTFGKAATHDFIPGNVKDLGVKIFNAEIIAKLNTKRYTTAIIDYGGRFIWADAPTLAVLYRSQFDRQFVRDTVYLAVGMAREVAEKYIGKPRLPQYLMTMKKDVGKAISMLVPDVLSDVFVDIVPVPDGHITGKTRLRLVLVTAKEIRGIDIETTISLAT